MEEMRETQPEGELLSDQIEQGELLELDDLTIQPESVIELKGEVEVAEEIENAFVNLMDQAMEKLESISVGEEEEEEEGEKEEEEGEYRIRVKIPWISDGDEDDMETSWARVATLTTDDQGAWYIPEIKDTVMMDSNEEIPPSAEIQPLEGADESGKLKQYETDGITYDKEGENGEDLSKEGGSEDESGNSDRSDD